MSYGDPHTRDTLIASAIRMFQQHGFQKTRVSDIVAEAGVAQGTFYNYFRSKDEVFRFVCNAFIEQIRKLFIERTEHLFDGDTAEEIRQNVLTVIDDLLAVYGENLDVAELLFREGIGNGGLFKEIYEEMLSVFLGLIEEQIRNGARKGFLKTEDPEIAAVFLFGLFERSLFYFLLVRKDTDLEKLRRTMADFILKGLSFTHLHRTP
ncbi:MAG: TetR/AcrR family transcriptional regulator [Thermodesulfobacteriota bacterium]